MPDWSYQTPCVERILQRRRHGVPRVVAAAPTGSGKTRMISMLFEEELRRGGRPIVYTNRKVLRKQITNSLRDYGIDVGVRASGVRPDLSEPAQVSSIDTERARSLSSYHPWDLHDSTLVIVDEAHSVKASAAVKILDEHEQSGAFICGFSATPVGLGFTYKREDGSERRFYDELLNLIGIKELRKRGVLVPCHVFSPAEIDMEKVDTNEDGEFVATQARQRFDMVKYAVLGSIVEAYYSLNPNKYPAVCFPPGVQESRWICDYLSCADRPSHKRYHAINGRRYDPITCKHIDADTSDRDREESFAKHQSGEINLLSSFGVLSEGWDAPWARHAILCRAVNSVQLYLQMVGRILRAHEGKSFCILQDHVGAWHRPGLGSPNVDREWRLEDTNKSIAKADKESRSDPEKPEAEPARCPKCSRVLAIRPDHGYVCTCGHKFKRGSRQVIQIDGTLERKVGHTVKKKRKKTDDDYFRSALFQAANSGKTVGQAYWLACQNKRKALKNDEVWISRSEVQLRVPMKGDADWSRLVPDVYPFVKSRGTK